jgi:hypothetical protein
MAAAVSTQDKKDRRKKSGHRNEVQVNVMLDVEYDVE